MTRIDVTLTILFADIAKSTHLYETLGDQVAKNLIDTCISLMTDITKQHGGSVVKTIGDEIMCTFPSGDQAVEAAKEMHQGLEDMTFDDQPGVTIPNIYVGLQHGPVILEDGDVFGDAVNVAARMVAQAKQRQIVTTEETVNSLKSDYRESAHCIDKTTLKGKSGEIKIYELIWERQDVTVMLDDSPMEQLAVKARLELKCGSTIIEVDEARPMVTLGRQSHNDVVVNDNRVSRSHARVEYRRGKFILIDQSSNGTYVLIQDKKSVTIKRDETTLLGHGLIGLGRDPEPDTPHVIEYSIKM